MSTSIDSQSNQSICDYIIKEGRVRELGVYQFIDRFKRVRLRLFSREVDHKQEFGTEIPLEDEYQLIITKRRVVAKPPPISGVYGLHKFYGGCTPVDKEGCYSTSTHYNCRLQQRVCLL